MGAAAAITAFTFIWALAAWVACAVVASNIAESKGRSNVGWGLVGLVFGPLGLAVGLMEPLPDRRGHGKCTICFEWVDKRAYKCPHCHSALAKPEAPRPESDSNLSVTGQPLPPL